MEGRPQLDRTYLPTPATTVEMYLYAMLDILVQIRDRHAEQIPKASLPPDGQVALREPAPAAPESRSAPLREQRQKRGRR